MNTETYEVTRMYMSGKRKKILTGLTLEEAQAHCRDPETSSSTCTSKEGLARTSKHGPWFDGYESE